jgi:hypothetical protein
VNFPFYSEKEEGRKKRRMDKKEGGGGGDPGNKIKEEVRIKIRR